MKKTFTLIEILVVATIIGLLASVVTVSYSQLSKESRNNRRKTDLEQIRSALEMYRSNNDQYPDNLSLLTSPTVYLQTLPVDPKSSSYVYYYSKISNVDYILGAYLEGVSSSCSITINCGVINCNYCLGPYGKK
ncbi:MAG: hypothetical protein Fur009_3730 [Candidatus Microgenomates bacterium]